MSQEIGQRIFGKSIKLLEERLRLKIKHAVLVVETDFGDFKYDLKDKPEKNIMLMQRFFNQELQKLLIGKARPSSLIECSVCLGAGEVVDSGLLTTCSKCRGGGVMAVTLELTEIDYNGEQTQ